jgi:hypothetical protein
MPICCNLSVFFLLWIIYFLVLIKPCFIDDYQILTEKEARWAKLEGATGDVSEDDIAQNKVHVLICVLFAALFTSISIWSFRKLHTVPLKSNRVDETGIRTDEDICKKCRVCKRPDISHCPFCKVCVEGHDHHCGVVGTCIGDPTFKSFSMYFVYAGLELIMMAVSNMVYKQLQVIESQKNQALELG